jgi:hypothetical protein
LKPVAACAGGGATGGAAGVAAGAGVGAGGVAAGAAAGAGVGAGGVAAGAAVGVGAGAGGDGVAVVVGALEPPVATGLLALSFSSHAATLITAKQHTKSFAMSRYYFGSVMFATAADNTVTHTIEDRVAALVARRDVALRGDLVDLAEWMLRAFRHRVRQIPQRR